MNPTSRRCAKPVFVLLTTLGLASTLGAQTTPPATPAATSPESEELVVLSPFEVNATSDIGYLAQNTLAGSRLNTNLKDTAAAISVLTPEFLKDIGATSMRDVILFTNNAVPDIGDAAGSVNGNPLIGHDEWQLRIRGLAASYARNFFAWETSSDFYNVERIDQSRGPNSILFGFGSAGGIMNTSTKQARLHEVKDSLTLAIGSWDRKRVALDVNEVLSPEKLAMRFNAVWEDGESWRQFEFNKARRAHLALKWVPTHQSAVRVEAEIGKVNDNIARPWLAIDQSSLWRAANRPTFTGSWPSVGSVAATFWPDHLVVADDGVVRNWIGRAYASNANGASAATGWNAPTWGGWQLTPANLAIIPKYSNLAGPDAERETKYDTVSAFYETQISERLSVEFALNHQSTDFFGYDADGSRATNYYGSSSEVWGDASADLPDGSANPNARRLYLENNWTRRDQKIDSTQVRASAAYLFDTGKWARHRLAAMYEHSWRNFYRLEQCEVFTNMPLDSTAAEADVNRVYRRHYFTEGAISDIHQQSWKVPVTGAGWVADQPPEDTSSKQHTLLAALQSTMLDDKLTTIFGLRLDRMGLDYDPATRDTTTRQYRLDPANTKSVNFNAHTFTAGGVYDLPGGVSVYGNHSNSREIPELRIHLINSYVPPMPKGEGSDFGLKMDFLDGRLYATAGYYTTERTQTTDWGDVQTSVTDLNTRVLAALASAGRITAAERTARTINANGYLEDSKAKGWEFSLIANPKTNWRISANFSINKVIKENVMADVEAWADDNTAFWVAKGGNSFLLGGGDWDTIGAQIGWLYQYHINNVTALNGLQARGERKYGANLYTKYTFSEGPMKNFSIGGGGRYQSKNIVGFYNGAVREGRSLALFDLSLGYTFKTGFVGKGSWVDLQLNVNNVFDTDKYQVYTLAWWDTTSSIPERIGLQEPRRFTLTAKLEF
jgi:iron complex outermembrane recepter protein